MKTIILTVLGLALVSCAVKADGQGQDSLPDWVTIVTDQQTQCQYLVTASGHAMVPRLRSNGLPYCE